MDQRGALQSLTGLREIGDSTFRKTSVRGIVSGHCQFRDGPGNTQTRLLAHSNP